LLFNFVMHCIISTVVVAFEINYLILSYLILSLSAVSPTQPISDSSRTQRQTDISFCHTQRYLPSCTASRPFGQFQIILLDDRGRRVSMSGDMIVKQLSAERTCDFSTLV